MTTETNKALLRRLFEAVNHADFALLDGHPGFWETRQVVPPMHAVFHDWQTIMLQQIAEEHMVFSYGVTAFTHVAPFAGIAPTNQRVTLEGFFLDQVADGAVVEHNGTTTWPNVLQQLGAPSFESIPQRMPRLIVQPTHAPSDPAARGANKATVARLLEALSRGDGSQAARHDGIGPLQEEFAAIRRAFPDLRYTLMMQAAEGNLVGTRANLRGTHTGELFGFAPTGKAISWDMFGLARVLDGAVVEYNGSADWSAALIHLGLLVL